jgi:hypothetical protein
MERGWNAAAGNQGFRQILADMLPTIELIVP